MTLTADWSAEIGGVLVIGAGTSYRILRNGSDWWGTLSPDTTVIARTGRHGSIAAGSWQRTRTVTFNTVVSATSATAGQQTLTALRSNWQPRQADTTLDIRVPGAPETTMRGYGRPGKLDMDQAWAGQGPVWATAQFDLTDPCWYGAEATVTSTTSPVIVTNSGNADTLRVSVYVSGNGGTPVISNSGDGGVITWSSAVAVGGGRVVDLAAQTVTSTGTGINVTSETANTSTWFKLPPGANSIHFQGCSGATVVVRSAWW